MTCTCKSKGERTSWGDREGERRVVKEGRWERGEVKRGAMELVREWVSNHTRQEKQGESQRVEMRKV